MMTASGRAWSKASATALVVFAVDQLTKQAIRSDLLLGERRDLIGPVDLVRVRNRGVAFGALHSAGWIVPALTVVAVAGVLIWFASNPSRTDAWLPAGLLLGGAAGNLFDRITDGAVTDFIKLPHWPAFNAADIAITVGVGLLVLIAQRKPDAG
jgi:signal peptidase II